MAANPESDWALKAAAFLAQALELGPDGDPAALAADFTTLKRDGNAAIFAAELASSVGPAAFLIYLYALDAIAVDGQSGRDHFGADLTVLETAAARDAPGPRLVAHALTATEGFILATTPATLRALTGAASPGTVAPLEASAADLLPTDEVTEIRRAGAEDLLSLLRAADTTAARWLAAIAAEGCLAPDADPMAAATIPFTEAETELALFLLDARSIQSLLRALNLLLTAARHGAGSPADDARPTEADRPQ